MTENQRLASGQNPKTLLPLRYVPPIASKEWRAEGSVVRGINAESGRAPVDVDPPEAAAIVMTSREFENFGQLVYRPGYEGATHLSNNGLVESGGGGYGCGGGECQRPVTSKEERRGGAGCDRFVLTGNSLLGPESIYDPRHYGFADRPGIVNDGLGRVEYDYRDVDRVRIPHFLTRHQLDQKVPVGDLDGNVNVNIFAVRNHTDSVLSQRLEMQEAWLGRRASDRLQRKLYPINTNGQYMSRG
jgi:hypothetical protein